LPLDPSESAELRQVIRSGMTEGPPPIIRGAI